MSFFVSPVSGSRAARRVSVVSLAALAVALVAGGCSLAPDDRALAPEVPQSLGLSDPAAASVAADWWKNYNRPELSEMVAQALTYNSDVLLAAARIDEAAAAAGGAFAQRLPNLQAGGAATRGDVDNLSLLSTPVDVKPSDSVALGGLLSFEIDLWGRLANAEKAARERLLASAASARTVRLEVASATVSGYVAVAALNEQIALTKRTISTRKEAYDLQARRLEKGDVDALTARQAEAQLLAAQTRLPALEQQKAQTLAALSVLLGKTPKEIIESPAFAGEDSVALPALPPLPRGEVSEVIAARPDLAASEHQMRAANADIGVARAAYLPRLSLVALAGLQSEDMGHLFDGGMNLWSLGANATMPVLDFGRARARVEAAEAKEKEAYLGYEKTVRVAFREIKDALSARAKTTERLDSVKKQVAVLKETARLARRRFDAGYSPYLEVLEAENSLFDAEIAEVEAQRQLMQASVDLYKALGGGGAE